MDLNNEREQYKIRQEKLLRQHVEEINSRLLPEREGYVRTTGPRRQYRASVRNGMFCLEEL
jgi:hypothetical protein